LSAGGAWRAPQLVSAAAAAAADQFFRAAMRAGRPEEASGAQPRSPTAKAALRRSDWAWGHGSGQLQGPGKRGLLQHGQRIGRGQAR
jgi:hypothetical protein